MGFFSWKTSDTKEDIWNCYTDKCRTVYLYCPDGTIIKEPAYNGYGEFAGNDAYALLAKWNEPESCVDVTETDRILGIKLGCNDEDHSELEYPLKFSFCGNLKYEDLEAADSAASQGFFDWE